VEGRLLLQLTGPKSRGRRCLQRQREKIARRDKAAAAHCSLSALPPNPRENWCKLRALPSAGEKVVCGGRPLRPPGAWALKACARAQGSATRLGDAQRTGVCQRVGKVIGPGSCLNTTCAAKHKETKLEGGCCHPRRANGKGQLVPARCCSPSSTVALAAGQLPQQLRLRRPSPDTPGA
jgi:hypothetical protein